MRKLKAYIPALLVGSLAYVVLTDSGTRLPLAEITSAPAQLTLQPGQHVDFFLDLIPLRQPPKLGACPTLSMHLRDPQGTLARVFDHRLGGRLATPPQAESCIRDQTTLVQSLLDPPLAPGGYQLVAGLWDPKTHRKFKLSQNVGPQAEVDEHFTVANVEVPELVDGAPEVEFDSAWGAVESGDFGSVRSRRPWQDSATISVTGPWSSAIELRLVFDLPKDNSTPGEVAVDCTGERLALSRRWQELRLRLPADSTRCQITLPPIQAKEKDGKGWLYAVSWAPIDDHPEARSRHHTL